MPRPFVPRALALTLLLLGAPAAAAPVGILVLREHGVGTAAQTQPYLDKFVALAARLNGWAEAEGIYRTTRETAEAIIGTRRPRFGVLSLGAFLALRGPHTLEVIGRADVAAGGGRQYHLVSRAAGDLAGCKGHPLASNLATDARFVDNVVAGGAFKLADFTLVPTRRPLQTLRKVLGGEATCALVDDAQVAQMGHIEGAAGVRSVWESARFTPLVVVAFPTATPEERAAFKGSLPRLCEGDGKATCDEVGLLGLAPAEAAEYAGLVAAYGP